MLLHWDNTDVPALTLGGHPLPFATQVRYLGVLLESDLNWMPHITSRIKSGRATLLRCNGVQGKLYGSSINMLLWFFEHVIMPHVAHGSFLYHTLLHTPKLFRSLQSLARVAYLQVSRARIHTLIAGFQMALGSMPPAHRLIFNNLRTWVRLNNYHTAPEKDQTLPPHLQVLFDDFINTGSTGAGYVFMRGADVLHESWLTLCHTKTIFQPEVMAITASLQSLPDLITEGKIPAGSSITIKVRSRPYLLLLSTPKQSSNALIPYERHLPTMKFAWNGSRPTTETRAMK
jgi:hypothetical protein